MGNESADSTFDALMLEGRSLADAGELEKAKAKFRAAAPNEPNGHEAELWLCRIAYRMSDWAEVKAQTTALLAKYPENREAVLLQARACTSLHEWDEASALWKLVVDERSTWPEAHYQLGRALLRSGRRELSWSALNQLRQMESVDGKALLYAWRLTLDLNDNEGARKLLGMLFMSHASMATRELQVLREQKNARGLAVALAARSDVLAAEPADDSQLVEISDALFRSAIVQRRTGNLLRAFSDYQAICFVLPNEPLALQGRDQVGRELRVRARQLLSSGDLDAATEAYRECAIAEPHNTAVQREYGRLLMRRHEWADAAAVWKQMIVEYPGEANSYLQYARSLERAGEFESALSAWRAVESQAPDYQAEATGSIRNILGRLVTIGRQAITNGQFLQAYQIFTTIAANGAKQDEAAKRLAQIGRNILKEMRAAYKRQDWKYIVDHAAIAENLQRENGEAQLLIARAAQAMHLYERAARAWQAVTELDPARKINALQNKARCLRHLKRFEEATRVVELLAALDGGSGAAEEPGPQAPAAKESSEPAPQGKRTQSSTRSTKERRKSVPAHSSRAK